MSFVRCHSMVYGKWHWLWTRINIFRCQGKKLYFTNFSCICIFKPQLFFSMLILIVPIYYSRLRIEVGSAFINFGFFSRLYVFFQVCLYFQHNFAHFVKSDFFFNMVTHPNSPGPTFIPCPTSIPESRVDLIGTSVNKLNKYSVQELFWRLTVWS